MDYQKNSKPNNNNNNEEKIKLNNSTYKLLFWNLLCDEYSNDPGVAQKIDLKYKKWNYRYKLFTQIFSDKNIISDLYCFVEVDKKYDIHSIINNLLGQKSFDSIYFPRPSSPLGIMILYNKVKYRVINSYKYLLGKYYKENIALVAIFQENFHPFNIFSVIVTHLKAWDKNEKIRIKQVNKLFYLLSNDKNFKNLKINKIIICGDFNTNPNSYCIKQVLDNKFNSVFNLNNDNENYTMSIDSEKEGIKKLKFDYIFINNNIEIVNKLLPSEFLDFEKGIPNEKFPSDHLYLFTEFKFCEKAKEIFYDYDNIIYDKSLIKK